MASLIHCEPSDFCEIYARGFIAYWSNSHMGQILSVCVCVCVYVYSVVSLQAQEKMFVCCYTFLFSQRIVPGAVKRFAVILFPQGCSGAGTVSGASEKLGSNPRTHAPHQYVCCCSPTTWYPRNVVQNEQWKMALCVPGGPVCICGAACRGWAAGSGRGLLSLETQVTVLSGLRAEWVSSPNSSLP